jgi:hypothetical protein
MKYIILLVFLAGCYNDMYDLHKLANPKTEVCYKVYQPENIAGTYCLRKVK